MELASHSNHALIRPLQNKWGATAFAVLSAAVLAFSSGAGGKGALALWPLFGAVNQLLATLALLVGTVYLKGQGGLKYLITGIPFVFMGVMSLWAIIANQGYFMHQGQILLTVINSILLALAIYIIFMSITTLVKRRKSTKETKKPTELGVANA